MRSPHETHGIMSFSHQIHVPHTITTTNQPIYISFRAKRNI